jgi:thioredoxin 1
VSENIMTVDQNSFQKNVLDSQKPVLVDFWAPWCGPCRAVTPIVEELAKEYSDKAGFAKVNVDESPILASQYGVMSIPTIIIFKGGKPAEQVIGYKPKNEFKKLIDNVLKQ